ncbi:thiolase family protein [Orrella marina]|nr:thiolase family protein [Orrella marina]
MGAQMMRGKYVIAGIGNTAFGKLGLDTVTLNVMACKAALEDAGVDKVDVDALLLKTPTSAKEILYGQKVAQAMGMQPRWGGAWDQGGAANLTLINIAMMAIETGQCEIALVSYADNPRSGNRQVYGRPRGNDAAYGWFSTAAGYGMIHRAHVAQYQTDPRAFGEFAIAVRKHGAQNPNAQLQKAISMDDYLASAWVVDPLRRDDCCLVSDGAAAVVVMSAEKARQLQVREPVPILGIGGAQESYDVHLRPCLTTTQAARSAKLAFEMAGVKPADISVAQIYDCFTITGLMTLEDYGFCDKGGVYEFVRDGQIQHGGRLPVNTSGGLLSETGTPGLPLVLEAVRQVRGSANLQVPDVRYSLVSNQGGTMHTHATMILGA